MVSNRSNDRSDIVVRMTDVLDKGFVCLEDYMASDLSVVNSARVSMNKRHHVMEEGDDKLIGFLMRHKHGTPFEHNAFKFHVKCPIFIAREWMRHRIGSFNEWSGRYSQLEREFYIPHRDQVRSQVGSPGHYTFERMEDDDHAEGVRDNISLSCEIAFDTYEALLEQGVAKEIARLCLPVNTYTQFYWTINARSLMNFMSLRSSENAQWEIRQYSLAIEKIFQEKMPITYAAFIGGGMVAP